MCSACKNGRQRSPPQPSGKSSPPSPNKTICPWINYPKFPKYNPETTLNEITHKALRTAKLYSTVSGRYYDLGLDSAFERLTVVCPKQQIVAVLSMQKAGVRAEPFHSDANTLYVRADPPETAPSAHGATNWLKDLWCVARDFNVVQVPCCIGMCVHVLLLEIEDDKERRKQCRLEPSPFLEEVASRSAVTAKWTRLLPTCVPKNLGRFHCVYLEMTKQFICRQGSVMFGSSTHQVCKCGHTRGPWTLSGLVSTRTWDMGNQRATSDLCVRLYDEGGFASSPREPSSQARVSAT